MTEAFVTLVTSDEYALAAMVLGHTLRKTKTSRALVVIHTDNISDANRYGYEYTCRDQSHLPTATS